MRLWPAPGWVLLLILAGAALAVWGLSRWDNAARFLGVAPRPSSPNAVRAVPQPVPTSAAIEEAEAAMAPRLAEVESRLRLVENSSRRTAGSVGRADALLVAFASRRAIDRGVPLGYLEACCRPLRAISASRAAMSRVARAGSLGKDRG